MSSNSFNEKSSLRFGFNKVEVFDLRDTDIGESGESFSGVQRSCPGDTEVQCFGRKVAVLELLLGGERGEKITDRGILRWVRRQHPPGLA